LPLEPEHLEYDGRDRKMTVFNVTRKRGNVVNRERISNEYHTVSVCAIYSFSCTIISLKTAVVSNYAIYIRHCDAVSTLSGSELTAF